MNSAKKMVPELRFLEFVNEGEWKVDALANNLHGNWLRKLIAVGAGANRSL